MHMIYSFSLAENNGCNFLWNVSGSCHFCVIGRKSVQCSHTPEASLCLNIHAIQRHSPDGSKEASRRQLQWILGCYHFTICIVTQAAAPVPQTNALSRIKSPYLSKNCGWLRAYSTDLLDQDRCVITKPKRPDTWLVLSLLLSAHRIYALIIIGVPEVR